MKTHACRLVGAVGAAVVACTVLAAADFWEAMPFQSWSDKDVQKMMTDSPWAREVTAALPPRISESGFGQVGRGGDGDGAGFGAPAFRVKVTVSWRSALPVRQALVRGQTGLNGTISSENQEFLSRPQPFYVVGLLGVPMQFSRTPLEAIKAESFLRRDRKPPIRADDVTFQRNGTLMLVAFPRADELTLVDRDVEFVTKLGDFGIKMKFRLKDMVFQGQLAL